MGKLSQWVTKHRDMLIISVIILTVIGVTSYISSLEQRMEEVTYIEFNKMLEEGSIKEVVISNISSNMTFTTNEGKTILTDNPKTEGFRLNLLEQGIRVTESSAKFKTLPGELASISLRYVGLGLLVYFMFKLFKTDRDQERNNKGDNEANKNKRFKIQQVETRFSHVAGHEEAKEDLKVYVDMLKNTKHYSDMGAVLPKGLILHGPPGTGKTLIAKALAGESGVNFTHVSGSDFVEKYVGVGAKRVRELFKEAKNNTPCIIFIDEIDAVGRKRNAENNDETDRTVNALLVEMDGFEDNSGVLVVAATNMFEELDDGLLRPGRFDRKIAIGYPEFNDRVAIIKVHSKNKHIADNMSVEELAKITYGMTGAGIESLLNLAAINAAKGKRRYINRDDIDEAHYVVVTNGDKRRDTSRRNQLEKKVVAYHEAGHALAAKLLTDISVPKVTIVPNTNGAGGITFYSHPERGLKSKTELINDVKLSYAGRAAEEIMFGNKDDITTGASNDIQHATKMLASYIGIYGMSESLGMINLNSAGIQAKEILPELSEMSKRIYSETFNILKENELKLSKIAEELIEKETINEEELDSIIQGKKVKIEETKGFTEELEGSGSGNNTLARV